MGKRHERKARPMGIETRQHTVGCQCFQCTHSWPRVTPELMPDAKPMTTPPVQLQEHEGDVRAAPEGGTVKVADKDKDKANE